MLSVENLLSLRQVGDPFADDLIQTQVRGISPQEAPNVLMALIRTFRDLDESHPVAAWANRVEAIPSWVDSNRVMEGQEVFRGWSLDIVTSLFCASLPFAYAAARGVEVLERTSQLSDPKTIARRIAETGQMLLDISEPGALTPGGRGRQSVTTVRLLHAVIRARLTTSMNAKATGTTDIDQSSGPWDSVTLGVPINQEDLLGTLLSFTSVVFRALEHMGIPLGQSAQESYLQLWATVGDLLGIATANLILLPADAEALTDVIAKELHAPSAAGVHLMDVLMGEMELSMPWGVRKLPRTLVRHLSGDEIADMLGVPPSAWWGKLLPVLAAFNRATEKFPPGKAALQAPSRLLGRSMIRMWIDRSTLGEGPTTVQISPETASRLGIHAVANGSGVGVRGRARQFRRAARRRQRARHGARSARQAEPSPVNER
jgi:ER-bound oxygenase mpaB/B'/Rubber oxygenase, catalytic domain